jgi:nucleoside-diphosphate-sugar epimerase
VTPANPLAEQLDAAVDHAEGVLRQLEGQRIFLTGGTGFIGSWLLELLTWANRRLGVDARVTVLTRDAEAFASSRPHLCHSPGVSTVRGDVRDFLFPTGTFTSVIHGAASSDDAWNRAHPAEAAETIIAGTRRSLEFAHVCGAKRFLLLSSGAVYSPRPEHGARSEDQSGASVIAGTTGTAYGSAKRVAETMAFLEHEQGLDVIVARIFSVYGPYLPLSRHFAIGNFIRDALLGQPVTVRGDGSPVRSYIYGADLAAGLLTCLIKGASGRAYDMGGAELTTLADLAHLVASSVEPPVEVQFLDEDLPSTWYVADTSRSSDELGFVPSVPLAQGIRATIAWARATGAVAAPAQRPVPSSAGTSEQ